FRVIRPSSAQAGIFDFLEDVLRKCDSRSFTRDSCALNAKPHPLRSKGVISNHRVLTFFCNLSSCTLRDWPKARPACGHAAWLRSRIRKPPHKSHIPDSPVHESCGASRSGEGTVFGGGKKE